MNGAEAAGSHVAEMRFRGVSQIVLFNWPFFACATLTVLLALGITPLLPDKFQLWVWATVAIGSASVVLSLIASWYAYDLTQPYSFKYLSGQPARIANIHAGFDESSLALKQRFPGSSIDTFDFYDPQKHTEASIRRRAAAIQHPCQQHGFTQTTYQLGMTALTLYASSSLPTRSEIAPNVLHSSKHSKRQ